MHVEQLYTGCLAQGAYYIESNGEAAIIDPLREIQPYLDKAAGRGAKIKYVLETHFWLIKKFGLRDVQGNPIVFTPKKKSIPRSLMGGPISGLGWALTGVCPGPLSVNMGHAYWALLIAIAGGLLGTYSYGLIREKLSH